MIEWTQLIVLDDQALNEVKGEERLDALAEFKNVGSMLGYFFSRMGAAHEDPDDAATWGPQDPDEVDWKGFAEEGVLIYHFGGRPDSEFETGVLAGFDKDSSRLDYESKRAKKLYRALGAQLHDLEYVLGELPSGKWALIGLTITGHDFCIEN